MKKLKNLKNLLFFTTIFLALIVSASCNFGDDQPPSGIDDLELITDGRLLTWTSPGDDGNDGQAILYLVRFFDSIQVADLLGVNSLDGVPFSDIQDAVRNNFETATQVPEFVEPQTVGNPEFISIPRVDIEGNTQYFYAVATNDEVGNRSTVSNVVQVNTAIQRARVTSDNNGSCIGTSFATGEIGGKDEDDPDEARVNDLIVGDPCLGIVYVFFGGVNLARRGQQINTDEADLVIIGDPNESFGASIEVWGSFHESAVFNELAIGAPGADSERGRVYVIFGDENLPSEIDLNTGDQADAVIVGEAAGDRFGSVLESKNITSDNLLVGAPYALAERGKVYIFDGDDISSSSINNANNADEIYIGEDRGDKFGSAITEVGDVDDSSPREFAVSSPGSGKVYVFFDDEGMDLAVNQDDVVVIQGSTADRFGETISGGFNINGPLESFVDFNGRDDQQVDIDDQTDFIIGAPGTNGNTGAVFVYSDEDLESANEEGTILNPISRIDGNSSGDNFGESIAVLPDINPNVEIEEEHTANVLDFDSSGADILIGAPGVNGNTGAVFIFFGEENFSGNRNASDADITLNGNSPGDALGTVVINAGEMSNDRVNDIAIAGNGVIEIIY